MKKKYSLIIFDWDGTLIDSVSNIVQALTLGAGQLGLPLLDERLYKEIIGLSLENAVRSLYPDLGEGGMESYLDAYRHHHRQLEQNPSRPYPGVTDGLDWLQSNGVKMAVATGKRRAGLNRSMSANCYESYFVGSRCADEARSKPDPMMLEQLLEELEVPVNAALMVGDSGFDMAMAAQLGMDRVAVSYGAQDREQLLEHNPVCVADSFDDLVLWLDRHGVN